MGKQSVSFLIESDKVGKLDSLASNQERDRSFILNAAVDQYLDLNAYHTRIIEEGIADAEAGRLVPFDEVKRQLAEQRAARKKRAGSGR
jgi:RHH-type transcriptional regulator, rel operon repressor / antitoxin RelB